MGNQSTYSKFKPIVNMSLYSLLTVASSLSMAFGDDAYERTYSNLPKGYERTYSSDPYERTYSMANGYDRTYHSDPYERTYSNIPRGYERTYSNLPRGYERTYNFDPYERTYSNDGHYPSQHDKYPPMKPHEPKYPSPHKTPRPSAWKKEKTPKPTAWKAPKPKKTPKPTKAKKTPKPTIWKTEKPTKAKKTPKPTWKKTEKPTWHKMEKTPKPTVWKSDHDKDPKHYSMNGEEQENDETGYLDSVMNFSPYGFDMCYLNDGEECTPVFSFQDGPNTGCYCRSGCCEGGRCVAKKPDYIGVPYCPSECRGGFLEPTGTC